MSNENTLHVPARKRFIVHVDMDSFYASAEIQRNKSIKDRPVIIGADPKEGKGRGVVIACNYAARSYGIKSGMPISQAWKLCPSAIYLKPDFEYYDRLSERVMNIIKHYADKFEQVSIDEAFIDISEKVSTEAQALDLVNRLKSEIKAKTGLTCSVGIASSKTVAKIATDLKKPDGVTLIPEEKTKELLAPLPVGAIPGVGEKTKQILSSIGINSIGELQIADESIIRMKLGKVGTWLWMTANGIDNEEVKEQPIKSLSTERTFDEDTDDWRKVEDMINLLSNELYQRLTRLGFGFKKVGVKIRFHDFDTHIRERMLASYAQDLKLLTSEAIHLFHQFQTSKKKVRLIGIKVSNLKSLSGLQTNIDEWIQS